MKNNIQYHHTSVKVASAALAVFVFLASLSFPAFADSSSDTAYVLPVTEHSGYTAQELYDDGVLLYSDEYYSYHVIGRGDVENNFESTPYYVATCYSSGSFVRCIAMTNDSLASYVYLAYLDGGSYDFRGSSLTTSYSFNGITYYWGSVGGTMNYPINGDIPVYSSESEAMEAAAAFLEANPTRPVPGGGGSSHPLNTSLPAGNAIIINVTGNNAETLSLSTSSALRHKDNWSDGNQMMGYFSSAPTSLSSPFPGTHSITWRGVGSPNLFGGYNTWNTTAPLLPSGNFLVIVNPAYPNDNPDSITSNQASNGSINISCGYCVSAQIVPLSSSWSDGSIVSNSGSTRLDGEYDDATGDWTYVNSATGQPQNPVSGGLTDVDAEHITINDWLQNISHQIGSFFSGAIGAVSTLVSAGSDFIHSLSGLYAWLPAPVYAVLTSALILVITIGVIKVFI